MLKMHKIDVADYLHPTFLGRRTGVYQASLPVGNITARAVKGGLDIAGTDGHDTAVIASATIRVANNILVESGQRGAIAARDPHERRVHGEGEERGALASLLLGTGSSGSRWENFAAPPPTAAVTRCVGLRARTMGSSLRKRIARGEWRAAGRVLRRREVRRWVAGSTGHGARQCAKWWPS